MFDPALGDVLDRVQQERAVWAFTMFGEQPGWTVVIGACEEYFEGVDAMGPDADKYVDAVCDHAIFLLGVCTAEGITASSTLEVGATFDPTGRPWPHYLGRVCHHYLKRHVKIRGDDEAHRVALVAAIGAVFVILDRELERLGRRFCLELGRTWMQVRARDWRKDPARA